MGKLTIVPIKGNTYYIPAPTNIGVYVKGNEATIIDSGLDKDIAKQILKVILEEGWTLKTIINTHSHADHIGGNDFLCEKTGCFVMASKTETPFIENTLLEPALLYGGYPFKTLKNKFLMAKPTKVNVSLEPPQIIEDTGIEIISLPGHALGMIGAKTPDQVIFAADSIFPQSVIDKYSLTYLWNVEEQLKTLDDLKELEADIIIPSHSEPIKNITELCEINKLKIIEIANVILSMCTEPITPEKVLGKLCVHYNTGLNATQYLLLSSTLRSYFTYLYEQGHIEASYEGNQMTWVKK